MLLIAYHVVFDLSYFQIIDTTFIPMNLIAMTIGTLFLLIVGISLSVSYSRTKLKKKDLFLKTFSRFLLLGAVALGITLATFVYPNDGFVVFGIIHVIALSVLLSYFFRHYTHLNLVYGTIIIMAGALANKTIIDSNVLVWLGFKFAGFYSLDYYPLLPWFGVVLIGMFIGKLLYPKAKRAFNAPKIRNTLLEFAGRNSLLIYLIHQPLIVGFILLFLLIS